MFNYLAAEAAAPKESAQGLGALGISGEAFVIQLITFVLVYFLLRKFAFGPIVKMLQDRRELIESGVNLGEEMKVEKAQFEKKVAKDLTEARKKADEIVSEAQTDAKQTIRNAEETASTKAATIVEEGKVRGEQEVTRARKQMESELAGLVAEATEVIIGEKVDAKKDSQLIDRALKGAKV